MNDPAQLFVLSASDANSLYQRIETFGSLLERRKANSSPKTAARNLAMGQIHGPCRCAVVTSSITALAEAFKDILHGRPRNYIFQGKARTNTTGLLWIFAGAGGQNVGMARELYSSEELFRAVFMDCNEAFKPYLRRSVEEFLLGEHKQGSDEVAVEQAVLFSIQVALAALWRSWGLYPRGVIGHSMGEIVAAHVIGAISLDSAVRIICARSAILSRIAGHGAMAGIALPRSELEQRLLKYEGKLAVAAVNSSRHVVVSGDNEALCALLTELDSERIHHARLKDIAGHSWQLEPYLKEVKAKLGQIDCQNCETKFYSTVAGRPCSGGELDAQYWADNLRRPVLFASAMERAFVDGFRHCLEVSAHPILLAIIEEEYRVRVGAELGIVPSLRRNQDPRESMLWSAARLYVDGADLTWSRMFA